MRKWDVQRLEVVVEDLRRGICHDQANSVCVNRSFLAGPRFSISLCHFTTSWDIKYITPIIGKVQLEEKEARKQSNAHLSFSVDDVYNYCCPLTPDACIQEIQTGVDTPSILFLDLHLLRHADRSQLK